MATLRIVNKPKTSTFINKWNEEVKGTAKQVAVWERARLVGADIKQIMTNDKTISLGAASQQAWSKQVFVRSNRPKKPKIVGPAASLTEAQRLHKKAGTNNRRAAYYAARAAGKPIAARGQGKTPQSTPRKTPKPKPLPQLL